MTNYISLEKWAKINHNEYLLEQWDYEANSPLTPKDISFGSTKIVCWHYECISKYTNKKVSFNWSESPNRRTAKTPKNNSNICKFIYAGIYYKGYNDLQTVDPELAKLFHPTKNGTNKASDYCVGSNKKVWWLYKYVGPKTNKAFNFEWQDSVKTMYRDHSNPFLTNHLVYKGFNDLETWAINNNRNDILSDWDYDKNNSSTPSDIVFGSAKRINWKCRNCGHEWNTKLTDRVYYHTECPSCAKWNKTSFPEQAIYFYTKKQYPEAINTYKPSWLNGSEIDIYIPKINVGIEYDGARYHQNIMKDIQKNELCNKHGIRLIRIREKGCPKLKSTESIDLNDNSYLSLEVAIKNIFNLITNKNIEVDINNDEEIIKSSYYIKKKNDSLENLYPEISKEWHPTLNKDLLPNMFLPYSAQKVWWICPSCGKEYKASISNRTSRKSGCPICSRVNVGKKLSKRVKNIETNEIFDSAKEAGIKYKVSANSIKDCCVGRSKTSAGCKWIYI